MAYGNFLNWINPVLTDNKIPTPMMQTMAGTPQTRPLITSLIDLIVSNIISPLLKRNMYAIIHEIQLI